MKHQLLTDAMYDRTKFKNALSHGASLYGIDLDDNSLSRFETYYDLILDWNARINLISRRDIDRFVEYHLLDSLKVASCFDMSVVNRMLDFGSGAGLPGIPLSLAFHHINTFLVDSRKKRCVFLEEAVAKIPAFDARVICSRLENLPDSFNEYFDMVITRGTVKLETLFSLSQNLVKRGGSLVSIKGDNIEDEFTALQNAADSKVFNIKQMVPTEVEYVRKGNVTIITKI